MSLPRAYRRASLRRRLTHDARSSGDECFICGDRFVGSSTCTADGPTSWCVDSYSLSVRLPLTVPDVCSGRNEDGTALYVSGAQWCVSSHAHSRSDPPHPPRSDNSSARSVTADECSDETYGSYGAFSFSSSKREDPELTTARHCGRVGPVRRLCGLWLPGQDVRRAGRSLVQQRLPVRAWLLCRVPARHAQHKRCVPPSLGRSWP